MDFVTSVFAFPTMKTKPGKFLFPGNPHNPGVDVAPSREFPSTADAIVEASVSRNPHADSRRKGNLSQSFSTDCPTLT